MANYKISTLTAYPNSTFGDTDKFEVSYYSGGIHYSRYLTGAQLKATIPSGITVGTTPIASGTNTRVLYQSGGVVSQSANFVFDGTKISVNNGGVIGSLSSNSFVSNDNATIQSTAGVVNVNAQLNSLIKFVHEPLVTANMSRYGLAIGWGTTYSSALIDVKCGGALSTDLGLRVRNSAGSADIFQINGDGSSRLNGSFGVNLSPSSSYPLASLNSTASGYGIYGINSAANGIGVYGASTINSNSTGLKGEAGTAGGSGYRIGAWLNAIGGASNWALYVENGDFSFVSTNGSKIGTATTQKLSFWNATPIAQPTTAIASATLASLGGTALTDTDTFDGYTLKQIVKALRNAGLIA
jgi:hypothetical protein